MMRRLQLLSTLLAVLLAASIALGALDTNNGFRASSDFRQMKHHHKKHSSSAPAPASSDSPSSGGRGSDTSVEESSEDAVVEDDSPPSGGRGGDVVVDEPEPEEEESTPGSGGRGGDTSEESADVVEEEEEGTPGSGGRGGGGSDDSEGVVEEEEKEDAGSGGRGGGGHHHHKEEDSKEDAGSGGRGGGTTKDDEKEEKPTTDGRGHHTADDSAAEDSSSSGFTGHLSVPQAAWTFHQGLLAGAKNLTLDDFEMLKGNDGHFDEGLEYSLITVGLVALGAITANKLWKKYTDPESELPEEHKMARIGSRLREMKHTVIQSDWASIKDSVQTGDLIFLSSSRDSARFCRRGPVVSKGLSKASDYTHVVMAIRKPGDPRVLCAEVARNLGSLDGVIGTQSVNKAQIVPIERRMLQTLDDGSLVYNRLAYRKLEGFEAQEEDFELIDETLKRLRSMPLTLDMAPLFDAKRKANKEDKSKDYDDREIDFSDFFSAPLVAELYLTLGILPKEAKPMDFWPFDFIRTKAELTEGLQLGDIVSLFVGHQDTNQRMRPGEVYADTEGAQGEIGGQGVRDDGSRNSSVRPSPALGKRDEKGDKGDEDAPPAFASESDSEESEEEGDSPPPEFDADEGDDSAPGDGDKTPPAMDESKNSKNSKNSKDGKTEKKEKKEKKEKEKKDKKDKKEKK